MGAVILNSLCKDVIAVEVEGGYVSTLELFDNLQKHSVQLSHSSIHFGVRAWEPSQNVKHEAIILWDFFVPPLEGSVYVHISKVSLG